MSFYHANPESLTEEQRRALDEKWRIEQEIDNLYNKPSNWKTVKSRLAEVALHSRSMASDVAAREEVATTVKSVPKFPADPPAASAAAVEPGSGTGSGSGAAALESELGLVAEQTPSDEEIFVALVFDFTASMQPHMNAAADAAIGVLTRLKKANPNTNLYAALVGYTDIDPFKLDPPKYTILDFTSDISRVHSVLKSAQANGGDDIAENMAGALHEVGKLSWPTETGPHMTQKVVIIADAPPHGKKYHTPDVTDNFPRGCPFGFDPNSQIEKFASKDIDVIVFRVGQPRILDKMIEEFQEAHQRGLIPGCTADFIVMDAIQQSAPSSYYRPSSFADAYEDDDDVDRSSMYVPEYEDVGAERSFGCDDDVSVPRSFPRSFPRRDVNRGGSDSDNEDPSFMAAPFMAAPMPAAAAANASMSAGHTMEEVFSIAFSTRKAFSKHKL